MRVKCVDECSNVASVLPACSTVFSIVEGMHFVLDQLEVCIISEAFALYLTPEPSSHLSLLHSQLTSKEVSQ